MACKDHVDDEFFGHLHDQDTDNVVTNNIASVDLEVAEASAVQRQFHTLGFHEAYEDAKDSLLQEGFETGYRQNFEAAVRIGQLLGEFTAASRLKHSSSVGDDRSVARLIRAAITCSDEQDRETLDHLEEQVKLCLQQYKK
ncbi:hypothetical protein MPSEU_000273800 [Mayamaea pseudoterrestris]|nr:hypothetical protein MPSEU_000273800 [Mayamaea pseudoterrestris]